MDHPVWDPSLKFKLERCYSLHVRRFTGQGKQQMRKEENCATKDWFYGSQCNTVETFQQEWKDEGLLVSKSLI